MSNGSVKLHLTSEDDGLCDNIMDSVTIEIVPDVILDAEMI
jgi:hypothetical protein